MAGLLTGDLPPLALARPVLGVFLPIGLVLLALAVGVALSLQGRGRKLRSAIGVVGLILAILGAWGLVSKPSVTITGLTAYPLQPVLHSGEPCPASIDVVAVVRGKGGPGSVALELSFFGAGKTVADTPNFEQTEKETREAFGPYKVALPRNPPRTGAPLLLRARSPVDTGSTTVVRNAGCVPRR